MLPAVKKIYLETHTGAKTYLILREPLAFPIFYALKYRLMKTKTYSTIKPIF